MAFPRTMTTMSQRVLIGETAQRGSTFNGPVHVDNVNPHPDHKTKKIVIIGVSVGVLLLILVLLCVICVKRNKKRVKRMMQLHGSEGENYYSTPSSRSSNTVFSYEELIEATNGFSQANFLGQGGFGLGHKGILPNGTAVAVKSLRSGSQQGEREFNAEVDIISQVHHRNLVSLVGFCTAPGKKLLVYKFVPNKTLEYHLYGNPDVNLDWQKRRKIAIGSANGLAYLHNDCQPQIIHRDIKAGNILLDDDFEPKVADFGLAKLKGDSVTHVSTRVMGTAGYISPEYYEDSQVTEKTDVFSFGVMLVAIITGRRPTGAADKKDNSYIEWAIPLLKSAAETGHYNCAIDSRLGDDYDLIQMAGMVACALACIRESPNHRPKMIQVARVLEGIVPINTLTVRAIMEAEIVLRR